MQMTPYPFDTLSPVSLSRHPFSFEQVQACPLFDEDFDLDIRIVTQPAKVHSHQREETDADATCDTCHCTGSCDGSCDDHTCYCKADTEDQDTCVGCDLG